MDADALRRQFADFTRAYMHDFNFLDRAYGLASLEDLLGEPDVVGVARFIELPAFEPARLFTLVYKRGSVEASALIGVSSLWYSKPQVGVGQTGEAVVRKGSDFDVGRCWRKSATILLPNEACPAPLGSWTPCGMRREMRSTARPQLWTGSDFAIGSRTEVFIATRNGAIPHCPSTGHRSR